jgi:hypothetical protein
MRCQYFFFLLFFLSCGHKKNENNITLEKENIDSVKNVSAFFPVTDYIKGEINNIKSSGKNPIKYFYKNGRILDSIWIEVESFESEFSEFINPTIDSLNDAEYYYESNFFDNTINAFTLSYDLKAKIPRYSNFWTHWDIYINPETNLVSRIYLVKQVDKKTSKQLTWLPYKSCKIITIKNQDSITSIENETSIQW